MRQLRAELRELLRLAIPVVLSEIGWMTMTVVDLVMVGGLGARAIGAVGLGNAVFYAPSLFGVGLVLGLDTLVSRAWGSGDHDACHRWLAQGVYIAAVASPLLMLFIWLLMPILAGHGVEAGLARDTRTYLLTLNWSAFPLLIYAAFRRYLQGVGRVRPVSIALISANVINLAGNWAFIYGHLGLPAWGVRGSALSTCFARIYMAAFLIVTAWLYERGRGHGLFHHWPAVQWRRVRALLALGLPAAVQIVLEVGAFGAVAVMASRLGPVALAAHEIALNCAAYTYMVPLGISSATAVAVGQASGAGEEARARRSGWMGLALAAAFMCCTGVVFTFAARPIAHLYTHAEPLVALTITLLAWAAAFQVFDGLQTVATGALRGLGETRMPMLANLLGYWLLGLPLGAFFCFGLGFGVSGLWGGLMLALVVIALVLVARWRRDARQLRMPRSDPPMEMAGNQTA